MAHLICFINILSNGCSNMYYALNSQEFVSVNLIYRYHQLMLTQCPHNIMVIFSSTAQGGLFFAKPMRDKKYVSMMDPFQIKYGKLLSCALVLPSLLVDVLWVSCTLLGLGKHTYLPSKTTLFLNQWMRLKHLHFCVYGFK